MAPGAAGARGQGQARPQGQSVPRLTAFVFSLPSRSDSSSSAVSLCLCVSSRSWLAGVHPTPATATYWLPSPMSEAPDTKFCQNDLGRRAVVQGIFLISVQRGVHHTTKRHCRAPYRAPQVASRTHIIARTPARGSPADQTNQSVAGHTVQLLRASTFTAKVAHRHGPQVTAGQQRRAARRRQKPTCD